MGTANSPETDGERGNRPPVALIAGPTASGKSTIAVELAKALEKQGRKPAIINADSIQVYRDLQVLSARPTETEMQGIDHRLFGTWDGAQPCSAAGWAEAAKLEIASLHETGGVPILVGGTGMYIQTLLDGIAPIPEVDPKVREEVRALSPPDAFIALRSEDPERAAQLEAGDSQRVARALEVVRSTGKPLAHWQQRKSGGIAGQIELHPLVLLPSREWLYERCDRRFGLMMEAGAIEEVEALLARALDPDLPVMRAIGVPEIAEYLVDRLSAADAIINAQQATRNYAKRQYTWFRRQPPEEWPRVESQNIDINIQFARLLQH